MTIAIIFSKLSVAFISSTTLYPSHYILLNIKIALASLNLYTLSSPLLLIRIIVTIFVCSHGFDFAAVVVTVLTIFFLNISR